MLGTSILTMIITMISRILGLFRGTLVAYFFGSNELTDAYYSAFKISNFFRQLLGEGALGNVFIPLYNKKLSIEGEKSANKFIFSILNSLFLFSILISILMIIFARPIISFMVVGFDENTKILATQLLRIMSVYFIFISLAGMIGSILNNFSKFLIPASTSIFFNLSIILATLYFSKIYGITALAYGVVVGGFFQFLIVFIPFLSILKKYSFKIEFKDKYLKMLLISLVPMLIGVFARQINTIVDQFFASFLRSGGVTALENATRIYLLPVGVFGVTLSNILFPSISKNVAQNKILEVNKNIVSGLNLINFLVVPSTVVLTLYSKEVIELIFSYGKFSSYDVEITSNALFYYSLGLIFYVGVHLISKVFYAFGENKIPAKFSIIAIVVNVILNYLLLKPLSYKGLAVSTAIASMTNFFLLSIYLYKNYLKFEIKKIVKMFFKFLISSLIAYIFSSYFEFIILKFIIFSIIYLLIWAYPLYRFKIQLFFK